MSASERVAAAWLRHPVVAFVRHRKVITFYRQLHALVKAGMPLPTAFEKLIEFAPDARMKTGLQSVARDVRAGSTLGDALRKHGPTFDDANVELVAFAEESGRLEQVLARLIGHLEQVQKQRWQTVLGALWPMYLVLGLVFAGPLLGVASQMSPGVDFASLYLRGVLRNVGTVVVVIGAVFVVPLIIAALDFEAQVDGLVRSIPFLSVPMRQLASSRMVLGLSLANASGMEVGRALKLAARASSSMAVLGALPLAEQILRRGGTLSEAVRALNALDATNLGMLSIAETTGTLDETLERMSVELQESSLRAMRFLVMFVTGLIAIAVLAKVVMSILGVLLGPVKTFYDSVGTGKFDGSE